MTKEIHFNKDKGKIYIKLNSKELFKDVKPNISIMTRTNSRGGFPVKKIRQIEGEIQDYSEIYKNWRPYISKKGLLKLQEPLKSYES